MSETIQHHAHPLGQPCNRHCTTMPERRRKPMLDMPFDEGRAFILAKKYTGPFTVHASEGVPKRIVLPNPEGW